MSSVARGRAGPEAVAPPHRWTDGRIALCCSLCALAVYLSTARLIPTDDAIPARYLPFSILRHGTFHLDGFEAVEQSTRPYFVQRRNGHLVSIYPVGAALAALPVYLPAVAAGVAADDEHARTLEKLAAATLVAVSVGLLFLALRQWTTPFPALALTCVYALGTSSFSASSQALWQHGPAQAAMAGALALLDRARMGLTAAAGLGACLAFAVLCRPTDVLIAAPLFAWVVLARGVLARAAIAGALGPVLFQMWYSAQYFGTPFHLQFESPRLW